MTHIVGKGIPDPRKSFGLKIKQLRQQKGWTQEELSFQAGLSRTYVGDVERGERNVALVNICILAKTLEVKSADLFEIIDR